MTTVINGAILSKEIRANLHEEVLECTNKYGRAPHLVVILVGENPASISYVTGKEKACREVGFQSTIIRLKEDITEDELLKQIDELNNDDLVDGILDQLPLPRHIDEKKVIEAISVSKDVDGFHPINVAKLHLGEKCLLPCTPKGIMTMLKSINVDLQGRNCCVIGRSNIVGKPIASLLVSSNATVTICHSKTVDLKNVTNKADILIVAIGKPKMITKDFVKPGAIVIDVGVNRVDGHLCGDVDYDDCFDICSAITPVPKGVGPMTITSLMENTLEIFLNKMQK